jgi:DNA-directed RNA polymerase specialized sigma24 family protein
MELQRVSPSKQEDGYELFRRAIVEQDEDAWAEIHTRYRSLMVAWAHHSSAATQVGEHYDDLADQAFARAWAALSPARFAQFPTLSRLLAYLRTCVMAVAIDCARARGARARMYQKIDLGASMTPEQIVLAEMERSDLWEFVSQLAETEQERVVMIETFVFDLPPRNIVARHRDLFANVTAVYAAKRNLTMRLQRNDELRQMCQDLLSA